MHRRNCLVEALEVARSGQRRVLSKPPVPIGDAAAHVLDCACSTPDHEKLLRQRLECNLAHWHGLPQGAMCDSPRENSVPRSLVPATSRRLQARWPNELVKIAANSSTKVKSSCVSALRVTLLIGMPVSCPKARCAISHVRTVRHAAWCSRRVDASKLAGPTHWSKHSRQLIHKSP